MQAKIPATSTGRKPRVSLCSLFTILLVSVVVVSTMPQWIAWYLCADDSTKTTIVNLMDQISNATISAVSEQLGDAEAGVLQMASYISSHPDDFCDGDGSSVWKLWEVENSVVMVPGHEFWQCGFGMARTNDYVSTIGNPHIVMAIGDPGHHGVTPNVMYQYEVVRAADNKTWTWGRMQSNKTVVMKGVPFFADSLAHPHTVRWSDVYVGVSSGTIMITGSLGFSPMHDPHNDSHLCGVNGIALQVDGLSDRFRKQTVGKTGYLWVVDANNLRILATSSPARLLNAVSKTRISLNVSEHDVSRDVGIFLWSVFQDLPKDLFSFLRVQIPVGGERMDLVIRRVDFRPGTLLPQQYVVVGVPVSDFRGAVNRGVLVTVAITLAMLVVVVVAAILAAVLISQPLRFISGELLTVSSLGSPGNRVQSHWFHKFHVISEVSTLSDSLGKVWMMLESFNKYVPLQILRHLIAGGEVAKLGVIPRHCSVAFCDIENFTVVTETTDPGILITVFTEFMDEITACIHESGGVVDKIIGDCAMGFWGFPEMVPDLAERACQCAVAATKRIAVKRESWKARGLPQLNFRIGISVGTVLVGNSGSSTRFNYTVLGSPVNLAARLEPLNKAFGTRILVSQSVLEELEGSKKFVFRKLGPCKIKGFENALTCHQLVGDVASTPPDRVEAATLWGRMCAAIDAQDKVTAVSELAKYCQCAPEDQFASDVLTRARQTDGLPNISGNN